MLGREVGKIWKNLGERKEYAQNILYEKFKNKDLIKRKKVTSSCVCAEEGEEMLES